jgi:plastocyanin
LNTRVPVPFGAQLKALREAAGFTQDELATQSGASAVDASVRELRERTERDGNGGRKPMPTAAAPRSIRCSPISTRARRKSCAPEGATPPLAPLRGIFGPARRLHTAEAIMFLIRFAAAATLSLLAVACGSDYSSPSTPSPAPAPAPAPGGPSSAITIPKGAEVLGNRAFTPDDIEVSAGTTVTWTNTDSVSHTSTSNASGWDSGIIAPGRQFAFTYQTAGTFPYHCAIHPGMVGTVVVR